MMKVGDRREEIPSFGVTVNALKDERMPCTVVYVHPQKLYYVVEFQMEGGPVRETYYFARRRG